MEHNPITSGDVAMSMASSERHERYRLEARVQELEKKMEEVYDWSEKIADKLNEILVERMGP